MVRDEVLALGVRASLNNLYEICFTFPKGKELVCTYCFRAGVQMVRTYTNRALILTTKAKSCTGQDRAPDQCPNYVKQGQCSNPDVARYCEKSCCENQ